MKYGVLGGTGFLGKHLCTSIENAGIKAIAGSRTLGVDARCTTALVDWIRQNEITHLINAAAECGGIGLNRKSPATLWRSTTQITHAVLEASRITQIDKVTMLGTVCSYAKRCPTPFKEEYLMHYGPPEDTNAAYGVAKLNGLFGCLAYRRQYGTNAIFLLPVNLYGPEDNFNPESSHVIPALIKKCVEARDSGAESIECWGTGQATREFLFVEDAAEAILLATEKYNDESPMNIGADQEITIKGLVELIAELTGFRGTINWNAKMPDGQPRRRLDVSKAKELGFVAHTDLRTGLRRTIEWYEDNRNMLTPQP